MKQCQIQNCNNKYLAKGYCRKHYTRNLRYGDPNITLLKMSSKGNGTIKVSGYRQFKINGKAFLEHRMIMEKYLGRKLTKYENIHHINGDRLDNRLENLELWNTQQPSGQRIEDKINFAKDIIQQYKILEVEDDIHYW